MGIFVCDLGFSSAKWRYGEKKGRVTSAFRRQGESLVLGDDALVLSAASYLKTMEELVRYYPVFVERCMTEAEVAEDDISLAVGLPYSYWQEQDKPGGSIPMLTKSLLGGAIKDVAVYPQGLGGIRDYLDNIQERNSENLLGIDIGFNTVIFTLFSPLKRNIIYGKSLHKRGVYQMATEFLLPKIKDLAPSGTFTPIEISYLIEKGFLQYGFERHDITKEIREAGVEYIKHILNDIHGELQGHVGMQGYFEKVLLFGGGAAFLKGELPVKNIEVATLPEPEYANARGFRSLIGK